MSTPLGQCRGCGGLLFANVFHVCPSNVHLYQGSIPQAELDKLVAGSYVPPPPAASDSGTFSEPPQLVHKTDRTHCDACKEPLDPTVMHKCHGNAEAQAWRPSTAAITEVCPADGGTGVLHELPSSKFVVVCGQCRRYLYPEVKNREVAISSWNYEAHMGAGGKGDWPVWLGLLPGEDERSTHEAAPPSTSQPVDLTNYKGVCPATHMDGQVCNLCDNTGVIPRRKEGVE